MFIVLDETDDDDDDAMGGFGLGPAWDSGDAGDDWLSDGHAPVADDGSLGSEADHPVEDVALVEGMDVDGSPDPAGGDEEKAGMCQQINILYICIKFL